MEVGNGYFMIYDGGSEHAEIIGNLNGAMNGTIKQQRSKTIEMRFCWLKDRAEQGQFKIHWAPGDENWADYFTKHHSSTHHQVLRPVFLEDPDSPADLQGCLERLQRVLGEKSQEHPEPQA